MKQYVAIGLIVGLVVGVVFALAMNANTNLQPAQADSDGLPRGVQYFTDRGYDCYLFRIDYGGGITCVNPVKADE